MTDRLWTVDNVSLAGPASLRLESLSTVIKRGTTAIIGDSGAGKTSLLNLLVRFENPSKGTVSSHLQVADRLPFFWGPQDDGLWPGVSVQQHLRLVQPSADAERLESLLADFDLLSVKNSVPERLSRGEASRLAIARAIATDAAVLVLDEPLSHVDPARRSRYWDRLASHCRESNTSLIFASHEPRDVLQYADWVVAMRSGNAIYDGTVSDLYENPDSESLATLLGPANWFSPADWNSWNLKERPVPACVRPERLALEPDNQSQISVVSTRQIGPTTESDVHSDITGQTRRFWHRPSFDTLSRGSKVRITLLGLFAATAFMGCDTDSAGPEIAIDSERRFTLPASSTELPAPRDITVGNSDEKVILDNAGRVLVYDATGQLVRQWNMPESEVGNPEGACVLPDGRIVVADTHYHRVVFFDSVGNVLKMFGSLGREPGQFIYPVAVTIDDVGHLYVAEYGGNDRIQKFDAEGVFLDAFGSFGEGAAQFQRPSGIVWRDGKLFVADAFNSRIHVFDDSGSGSELLGASNLLLHYPYDISLGPEGHLYVVEYGANRVTVLTTEGKLIGRFGTAGRGKAQFWTPWGLAVDSAGRVWVADTGNRRVVEIVPRMEELTTSAHVSKEGL